MIKNITILGGINTGKTTLIKKIIEYGLSNILKDKKEEAIDIDSKIYSINYKNFKLNLLDSTSDINKLQYIRQNIYPCNLIIFNISGKLNLTQEIINLWYDTIDLPKILFINKLDEKEEGFFKHYHEIEDEFKEKKEFIPLTRTIIEEDRLDSILNTFDNKMQIFKKNGQLDYIEQGEIIEENDDFILVKLKEDNRYLLDERKDLLKRLKNYYNDKTIDEYNFDNAKILNIIKELFNKNKIIPIIYGSNLNKLSIDLLFKLLIEFQYKTKENEIPDCFICFKKKNINDKIYSYVKCGTNNIKIGLFKETQTDRIIDVKEFIVIQNNIVKIKDNLLAKDIALIELDLKINSFYSLYDIKKDHDLNTLSYIKEFIRFYNYPFKINEEQYREFLKKYNCDYTCKYKYKNGILNFKSSSFNIFQEVYNNLEDKQLDLNNIIIDNTEKNSVKKCNLEIKEHGNYINLEIKENKEKHFKIKNKKKLLKDKIIDLELLNLFNMLFLKNMEEYNIVNLTLNIHTLKINHLDKLDFLIKKIITSVELKKLETFINIEFLLQNKYTGDILSELNKITKNNNVKDSDTGNNLVNISAIIQIDKLLKFKNKMNNITKSDIYIIIKEYVYI